MNNIDPINEGITDDTIKVLIAGREFSLSQKQAEQVVHDLSMELHTRFIKKFDGNFFAKQALHHMWPFLPDSKQKAPGYRSSHVIDYDYGGCNTPIGEAYGDEYFAIGHAGERR